MGLGAGVVLVVFVAGALVIAVVVPRQAGQKAKYDRGAYCGTMPKIIHHGTTPVGPVCDGQQRVDDQVAGHARG